ncbi:hypothetical protein [Kitasatospora sp. NPDC018619]|uniref:hypothetical protein n=1 Tax=unclassified Kitasatospora TaxID=2633591 RepID=UPI0037B72C65
MCFDLISGAGRDGSRQCWVGIRVRADALRLLGLHPEQASAAVTGPSPPGWWHAAAERRARG